MIIEKGHRFDNLPVIDEPEMVNPKDACETVQMEGFKYVTKTYDVDT